uniref:Uncharacterized protein n=1 Tax=Anopheles merus TaxID=30066 RepID=A0A182VDG4_ANOME
MQGAASRSSGDATSNSMPNPAKIPITWARCHTTEAREWPSLFLHGPLSLARQYQQKTCLHRLHIICAQPSSFSIGTVHIGQHLMRSLSNGMPNASVWPSTARRREFSSHDIKSSRHVGQCTAHGDGMLEDDGDSGTIRSEQIEEPVWFAPAWSPACCSLGPTRQIVSQPAFGHQFF